MLPKKLDTMENPWETFLAIQAIFTIISGRLYRLKKKYFLPQNLKIFRRMFFQDAQKHFGQFWNLNCLGGFLKTEKTHYCPKKIGHLWKTLMHKSLCILRFFMLSDNLEDLKGWRKSSFYAQTFWALGKKIIIHLKHVWH